MCSAGRLVESPGRLYIPEGPASLVHRTATEPFLTPGFADGQLELFELAGPEDLDRLGRADLDLAKSGIQFFQALRHGAVERDQGVTLHHTGLVCRALRLDRHDQKPAVLVDPRLHGVREGHLLGADAEVGTLDPAIRAKAGDDSLGDVHRDRPSIATAKGPAVHPDGTPLDIDQRATAETGIERRVGLDQVFDLAATPPSPRG